MHDQLWDVDALSAYLGKPVSWVYDNHVRENIPSIRVGQQLRFSPTEILRWMEKKSPSSTASTTCDVARPLAGWPLSAVYFASVPSRHLDVVSRNPGRRA